MATHLMDIKVGDKRYYISYSGSDVYYSTTKGSGSFRLRKAKFNSKRNELLLCENGDCFVPTEFELAQAIRDN